MKLGFPKISELEIDRSFSLVIALLSFATVAQLSAGYIIARDPWTDEAMLATNILSSGHDLAGPMPYYNQAAPVGYSLIGQLANFAESKTNQISILRFVSIIIMMFGISTITIKLRRFLGLGYSLAFLSAALSSSLIWRYGFEIKHYGLEFTAGGLVMIYGLRLASQDSAVAHVQFLACALVANLAAFTAPIIICAALSAAFIMRIARTLSANQKSIRVEIPHPLSLRFIATGIFSVLAIFAAYFFINRYMLVHNSSAYAYIYDRGKLDFSQPITYNVKLIIRYISIILEPLGFGAIERILASIVPVRGVPYALSAILGVALLVLLIANAFRREQYFVLTFLSATTISIILNVAGLLAFDQARHFLFLAPATLMLAAFVLADLWKAAWLMLATGSRRMMAGLATAAFIVMITAGAYRQATSLNQEISPLLLFAAERDSAAPIWVYCGAQPAANLLARPGTRFVGTLDRTSGPVAWEVRGGCMSKTSSNEPVFKANPEYASNLGAVAVGQSAMWLLFAHDFYDPDRQSYLSAAEKSIGRCEMASGSVGATLYYCSSAKK